MSKIFNVAAIFIAGLAAAADDRPLLEQRFGRDPLAATLGDGGLTIGLDGSGRVCALRWPSPGYYGQLTYDDAQAPTGIEWGLLRDGTVYWMHGPEWACESLVVASGHAEFELKSSSLALNARIAAWVEPALDRFEMTIAFTGARPDDQIVWFADITPATRLVPELLASELALRSQNDFASFVDEASNTVIHFRPAHPGRDEWSRAEELAADGGEPDAWKRFGNGTWLAYTVSPRTQLGCFENASGVDGGQISAGLANRNSATGSGVVSAAVAPLGPAEVRFTLWAAESFDDLERAMNVRVKPSEQRAWPPLIETLRAHQDRKSGSVVRSVASRPPLHADWPRYGAWVIRAFDLAGDHESAARLIEFYLSKASGGEVSEGALPYAVYPNGVPATPGNLIDTEGPAWAAWAAVEHVNALPAPERTAFLDANWDRLAGLADFVVNWAEDTRGIPWHGYDPELGRDRRDRSQIFTGHLALSAILPLAKTEDKSIPESWTRRKKQWDTLMDGYRRDPAFRFRDVDLLPFWAPEFFPRAEEPLSGAILERLNNLESQPEAAAARQLAEIGLVYGIGTNEARALRPHLDSLTKRLLDPRSGQAFSDSYAAGAAFVATVTVLGPDDSAR